MTSWLPWRAAAGAITGHVERARRPDDLDVDAEGWLVGQRVQIVPSVRSSRLTTPQPIAIVWHYTATDIGTAASLAKRIRKMPPPPPKGRKASWSVLVAADGVLWQSVPFLRGSWHCAKGLIDGHRVNSCSVGVELEGHGKAFPDAQIAAAGRLVRALVDAYDLTRERARFGHVQFDPARRSDPGPLWSTKILPALLDDVYAPIDNA